VTFHILIHHSTSSLKLTLFLLNDYFHSSISLTNKASYPVPCSPRKTTATHQTWGSPPPEVSLQMCDSINSFFPGHGAWTGLSSSLRCFYRPPQLKNHNKQFHQYHNRPHHQHCLITLARHILHTLLYYCDFFLLLTF